MPRSDHITDMIRLRRTEPRDLPALFEMEADRASCEMAGTKPRSREAFFAAWERIFSNPRINSRVIEIQDAKAPAGPGVVGGVSCFQATAEEERVTERDCIGYSVARAHWGKGIASRSLAMFLGEERRRPLHATAAGGNAPSRRVLEKCGFRLVGVCMGEETDRYLACEIAEYRLE